MLLFKKKFIPAINAGTKTQTIRLWKHRKMKAGQQSYTPGVGYLRITAVDEVTLDTLTDEDAKLDGFDTLAALCHELKDIYGDQLSQGWQLFRVRFEVLDAVEQLRIKARKASEKAAAKASF